MIATSSKAQAAAPAAAPRHPTPDRREMEVVLATVSHELRRPLTAILGWTRLLRSGRSTDVARGLEVIERCANQQRLLIEELLDLSRTNPADRVVSFSAIDLNGVIADVADAARPAAGDKGVQLVVATGTRPVVVHGDARRLQQIGGNLVANAIKFTPAGGSITLTVARADDRAVIEVADSGVGMTPTELASIFDPFWQADSGRRLSREGLGLGLTIVRRLVELHGGTIEGASAGADCGTSMIVRLPLEARHRT